MASLPACQGKKIRRFLGSASAPLTVVSEHAGNRESSFCLVFSHNSAVLPQPDVARCSQPSRRARLTQE